MTDEPITGRTVLAVTGRDRVAFLQGLVTNDVGKLKNGLVYTALLTPQGKYLADFFLVPAPDAIWIDVADHQAGSLMQRLLMYRLRADVAIAEIPIRVLRGTGPSPAEAFADPRHPALGWRCYGGPETPSSPIDWDAIRVAHCIPQAGTELVADETYILEAGFERLNGVDFRKGCYVGQEVTARMKHKTELRKGFVTVRIEGPADPGSEILAGGKPAGRLCTRSGDRAIAWLRFDRVDLDLQSGAARIFTN